MEVWCLKHLVYKYVCMCIMQDTCMLFTCVLTRFAAFVRKHIVTEQEMNIIHFVVEFGVFFASMLFCALSKPACVFIEQMQSCQSQSYWTVWLPNIARSVRAVVLGHSLVDRSYNSGVSIQYTSTIVSCALVCVSTSWLYLGWVWLCSPCSLWLTIFTKHFKDVTTSKTTLPCLN